MALLASQGGLLNGVGGTINNASAASGIRSASVNVATDGTYTFTGPGTTNGNWYSPTTTGIGSSWWVKFTVASSTNSTNSGSIGSWTQLTSTVGVSASNSSASVEGTGSFTVQFSPDGGTTVAATGTVNWDVGMTH